MAEIVGFVGMSHAPFMTMDPPQGPDAPGARFVRDAERVQRAVAQLAPDVVVVVGPDHFHGNFYDVMPPFVLGVERARAYGDFGSRSGELPLDAALAWQVHAGVTAAGFDLAISYDLTVDHGLVQGYDAVAGDSALPLVPLVVNTAAPPLPGLDRCAALGRALGDALRAADAGRVLVLGSGGLSHWLPSNDPRDPSVVGARRDALIHGREDVDAFTAAREPRVRAMGGNPDARVNADWDRWFLQQLGTTDAQPVVDLGHAGLEEAAGTGGHELRTWLIGHAAAGAPLAWSSYEPVPEWITGMGSAATFDVDALVGAAGAVR